MSSQELNHGSNSVHFFKIILQTTLQQGKLRVPISFVRRHWKGISNPVTLRLPNSTEKKVSWEKTSDYDVWFCDGWKEFTNYLSLRHSQLVVFQYEENSSFKVIVLSASGLEIKYPLRRKTSEEYEEIEESDCSLKIIEDPSSSRGKRTKSPLPSSKVGKKMKINPKESKHEHEKRIVQTHAGSSFDNLNKRSNDFYEKVMTNFNSDKNFFACILQKSYIERDVLVIPIEFGKTHLQRMVGRNVTLFVDKDRTWNVDLKLVSKKQFALSGGWSKFRAHYNLKFGDVCVFILNKCEGTVSFQVVIFSLEKEMRTPYFEG
ncbi:hypothetical protein P8452_71642 [Trifolium repens]|nr:hypothetical protein P8452_71642 [Trifolium repens]